MNKPSTKLWIAHQNARSLRKNGDILFAHFAADKILPDILFFSEVWINSDELNAYSLNNFTTVDCCNNSYTAGGIVGYVKNGVSFTSNVKNLRTADVLQINFNVHNDFFSVICVYRFNFYSVDAFVDDFSGYLTSVHTKNLFVLGDLNINLLKIAECDLVKNYVSMMSSFGLKSIVNEPTRITQSSATCIDHIFARLKPFSRFDLLGEVWDYKLSDHCLISLKFDVLPIASPKSVGRKQFRKINYDKLNELLQVEQGRLLFECDAGDAFKHFMDILTAKIEDSSYTVEINFKRKKIKPWMSNALLNRIELRNSLLKLLHKNPNNVNLLKRVKSLQQTICMQIKTTKEQYYLNKFDQTDGNIRSQWRLVNEITGNEKSKDKITEIINCLGVKISDPIHIAESFNNYFIEIPSVLKKGISNSSCSLQDRHMVSRNFACKSIFFSPISPTEILNYISSLDNSHSCGFDNISNFTIKKISSSVAYILSHIFNLCLQQGIFPDSLKIAVVIPLFKKGNKSDVSNYRPISLLSAFAKIFEKCIKSRLLLFFNENSFFSNRQYCFREGRSTEMALNDFMNRITNVLNDSDKAAAIFLDLTKAFDTVDHDLLLYKLNCAGIRGIPYKWFESYLENRVQIVKIEDRYSDSRTITCGVPQGSVLGPILFLVYVNTIFDLDLNGSAVGFADDIAITYRSSPRSVLSHLINHDLFTIRRWLDLHFMVLSTKSRTMFFKLFGSREATTDVIYHSILCNNYVTRNVSALFPTCAGNGCTLIELTDTFKYLGVSLDSRLNFKSHLGDLQQYIYCCNRQLYFLRMLCPRSVLLKFYYGLLQSKLQYGITIWGGVCLASLKPLIVAQNTSIRIIMRKPRLTSALPLFRLLKILPVRYLYVFKVLKMFFLRSGNRIVKTTNYNLRNTVDCVYAAPKKEHFRKFNSFIAPVIFNRLPLTIKIITKIDIFQSETRNWLLSLDSIEPIFAVLV